MRVAIGYKQVSPCIYAKARFALGLTQRLPTNKKTCSQRYWIWVVEHLGKEKKCTQSVIEAAKARADLYARL